MEISRLFELAYGVCLGWVVCRKLIQHGAGICGTEYMGIIERFHLFSLDVDIPADRIITECVRTQDHAGISPVFAHGGHHFVTHNMILSTA